jgi:hypothetical protein
VRRGATKKAEVNFKPVIRQSSATCGNISVAESAAITGIIACISEGLADLPPNARSGDGKDEEA